MQTELLEFIPQNLKVSLSAADATEYSINNMGDSAVFGATDILSAVTPAEDDASFRIRPGETYYVTSAATFGLWFWCGADALIGVEVAI